jgi:hypothetical protein
MEESVQEINSHPVTAPQTPSTHRKIIPLIVVALVTALLASLGTYFVMSSNQNKQTQIINQNIPTSHPSPTAITPTTVLTNTYSNERLGILFNYPTEWEVVEIDSKGEVMIDNSEIAQRIEIQPKIHSGEGSVIFITYFDNPKNLTLEKLEEENIGQIGMGPGIYSADNKEVTTATGIKAYYSEKVACSPSGCQSYILPYKNKVFTLRSSMNQVVPDQKEILDQILATLKFIN